MKFPLFKCLALAGALVVAWSCSDDSVNNPTENQEISLRYLDMGDQIFFIFENNEVKDAAGNPIGRYIPEQKIIVNVNGDPFIKDVEEYFLRDTTIIISNGDQPLDVSSDSDNPMQPTSSNEQPLQPTTSSNSQPIPPQPAISSNSQPSYSSSSQQPWQPTYSSSSNGGTTTGCPNIVTKGGGGSGWATRYWDGCKPSCSWTGNAGGKLARQCTSESKGKQTSSNWDAGSVCDGGGNMMACTSQIPFTVNGCSDMAFAFAAVPASNGGQCGKCFQLTFTGEGNWETTANHQALKGKKLIIMVTNVGHDVQQGQFDIMIPGGGPGAFNATSRYGWGAQGEQYGGLLSNCESESGWDEDFASKRKTCLENKCKNAFGGDSEAIQGCLFLATWMNAAGNPKHNYVEVDCPAVLSNKY